VPRRELRVSRTGTVINLTSSQQEGDMATALLAVTDKLNEKFGSRLEHVRQWKLHDVVERLRHAYPDVEFFYHFETSAMKPDGGILSMLDKQGASFPILIAEVKNQGTNDVRALEGKAKQAKGNAVERLGKNVIGFRTAMLSEAIMPFICFGYGCDFAGDSSILDRVVTINMFGPLNKISVVNEGENGVFNRGSFFFRAERWTTHEMATIMYEIAERSVYYYWPYAFEWGARVRMRGGRGRHGQVTPPAWRRTRSR
jgi:type II restriction enzyme